MAWARVVDGQVVATAATPPSALPAEDGSVTLGIDATSVTELATAGWYPVTDEGPVWDSVLQTWDGQRPRLEVTPGGVTAVYAIEDRTMDDILAAEEAAVDAEAGASLAALRDEAVDALLTGEPMADYADRAAAITADAQARKLALRDRPRESFAGGVVRRPAMTA